MAENQQANHGEQARLNEVERRRILFNTIRRAGDAQIPLTQIHNNRNTQNIAAMNAQPTQTNVPLNQNRPYAQGAGLQNRVPSFGLTTIQPPRFTPQVYPPPMRTSKNLPISYGKARFMGHTR
jgi:hypothetical protein